MRMTKDQGVCLCRAAGQMCLKHSICAPRRVRNTLKDVGSLGPHLLIKNYKGLYLDLKNAQRMQADREIQASCHGALSCLPGLDVVV